MSKGLLEPPAADHPPRKEETKRKGGKRKKAYWLALEKRKIEGFY